MLLGRYSLSHSDLISRNIDNINYLKNLQGSYARVLRNLEENFKSSLVLPTPLVTDFIEEIDCF